MLWPGRWSAPAVEPPGSGMRTRLVLAVLAAAVLALGRARLRRRRASSRPPRRSSAPCSDFRQIGGRIVLLPGDYRQPLVDRTAVGTAASTSWGRRAPASSRFGSCARRTVIVRRLDRAPARTAMPGIARRSAHARIVFRGDTFTAKAHRLQGRRCGLNHSRQASWSGTARFSHCGDRTPKWSTCLLPRWAAHVADRAELVPRLPRLRLHRRPGRAEPGHPPEPLRPRAGLSHGLGEVQPTRT